VFQLLQGPVRCEQAQHRRYRNLSFQPGLPVHSSASCAFHAPYIIKILVSSARLISDMPGQTHPHPHITSLQYKLQLKTYRTFIAEL
jgi:hypothetical protein